MYLHVNKNVTMLNVTNQWKYEADFPVVKVTNRKRGVYERIVHVGLVERGV